MKTLVSLSVLVCVSPRNVCERVVIGSPRPLPLRPRHIPRNVPKGSTTVFCLPEPPRPGLTQAFTWSRLKESARGASTGPIRRLFCRLNASSQ